MAVPIGALVLALSGVGLAAVVAAVIFETVYFGEDLANLAKGEFEEMSIFKALKDIIAGLSIIVGAEAVRKLNRHFVNSVLVGEPIDSLYESEA